MVSTQQQTIDLEKGGIELPFLVTMVFWMTVKVWDAYDTIIHQGGTSSSKTYSILQWLILKAVEKKRTITVAGQDLPNLRVGALRDFQTIINKSPIIQKWIIKEHKSSLTYTFFNGSIIEFKSYDSPQDAKSGKRDILFFNEVNGTTYEIFSELADRSYEKVIVDYNPTAKFWVHTKVMPDPDAIRVITNYKHNQFCPAKTIKKLLRYKETNPHRWRVYGLGLTGKTDEIIYHNVEWISWKEMPDAEFLKKYGYGMDYGFSKDPTTLVRAGMYQGGVYAEGLIYESHLRLTEIVTRMELFEVDKFDLISMDDSQAKEQSTLLREDYKYYVKSANRKGGSINSGISLLQDYPLFIVADEDWQKEQENYKWIIKNGEITDKAVDKYNHYWDALRYWALEMIPEGEGQDYEENYETI